MLVDIRYCMSIGKLDSCDWIECKTELTDEEADIYNIVVANEFPLNKFPPLQPVLQRIATEIEAEEKELAMDSGVYELLGKWDIKVEFIDPNEQL